MSLIETLFKKNIKVLELIDIQEYFTNDKHEANNIEFKSYYQKGKEFKDAYDTVLKAICAFLNTEGGIIIWGAPKGIKREDDSEKSYFLSLKPVPYKIEDDQFVDKISGSISPLCKGVSFHRIKAGKNDQDKDTFIYVIEVQKSEFPPHQFDGTYYMRSEASTRIQPHAFVEAQIKRISFPRLEFFLDFEDPFLISSTEIILIPFTIIIYNQSNFINEKNLQYGFLGGPCDLIEDFHKPRLKLKIGFNKDINGKKILHKNIALYGEYCLAVARSVLNSHDRLIKFSATVWGELSPVISSYFEFKIIFDDSTIVPKKLDFKKREENKYLWDSKVEETASLEKQQHDLTTDLKDRIYQSTFYNALKNLK